MAEKKRTPRWAEEDWMPRTPDDDIICKYCMFRKPDEKAGKSVLKGYTYGTCELFPKEKPEGVLFDGAKCPYFTDERED
jgi:hypothetical protein